MPILIVWWALILYGILAVFSVSTYESFSLTLKIFEDPTNYFYFFRHLKNIVIAIIMALAVYKIPVSFFQKQKNIMWITVITFVLQLLVFVPWIWIELNWSRWWIWIEKISFLPTIQPCEFFKLWYVLFMSWWLIRKKKEINDDNQLFLSFLVINALFLAIFCFIPDFWSALVMGATVLVMWIYAGMNRKKILLTIWIGMWSIVIFGNIAASISTKFAYLQQRMTYFISWWDDETSQSIWWQNEQALAAIGWGGFKWNWYWKGLQKFGYIPEAQSDFIFAAFSEEVGFVWDIALLFLYFYLMYYVLTRLKWVHDDYGKLIAVGLLSLIIVQAFINIWVNLKILPNTWLTLPFISHWWTALMANCMSLMLIYKIIKNK